MFVDFIHKTRGSLFTNVTACAQGPQVEMGIWKGVFAHRTTRSAHLGFGDKWYSVIFDTLSAAKKSPFWPCLDVLPPTKQPTNQPTKSPPPTHPPNQTNTPVKFGMLCGKIIIIRFVICKNKYNIEQKPGTWKKQVIYTALDIVLRLCIHDFNRCHCIRLFVQQLVQPNDKGNVKVPYHWPFVRGPWRASSLHKAQSCGKPFHCKTSQHVI